MISLPIPSPVDLAEIERLHGAALYLDAYHLSRQFAPLEEWPGTEGLILAGRLASCWGDWSRSNRLHTRAWRGAPSNPMAIYYRTLTIESHHGPFEALGFIYSQRNLIETTTPTKHHVWLWLEQAQLLGTFRDFAAAEALLRRAEPHAEGAADPWWWVEQARLLEQQDRYTEALASVDQAARIRPHYRQAIETKAHLLALANRDEEAISLLQDAVQHLQAANLAQSLAVYLSESERHEEALSAINQAAAWLPCADRHQRSWLAARRSDALRHLGRRDEAIAAARETKLPFFDHLAKRLETPPATPGRVHLRVGFVRQHHMTCAPATLSALGSYWNHPADHLELARLISYDGTPDHEERHWAETHGWTVREFRVTWATAVALLDRGCPFTLTTVSPRSAHLQAVVGYDAALELLLIRDPYLRTHGECIAPSFLETCASHGPRGMVLVPTDRAHLLAGIEFPDAPLYDRWFALRRALAGHNRLAAQAAGDGLTALAPTHRLALVGQRELALYDGNLLRQLEMTRALLALFPDDPNFLLDETQFLRALGRAAEQRDRITNLVQRRQPDPLFLREGAELLAVDGRTYSRAHRLFRRVLRRRGVDAWNLHAFANLLWSQQQFAPAAEVYRLAACVGEKTETLWDSYFNASRHVRSSDSCLALLREREARLGAQSGQPVRTLFRALETLDQTPAGFVLLDAALARRPEDGELLLFAADCRARFGAIDEAQRLLAAAIHSPRTAWLRTAARLAEVAMNHKGALGHWRELLTLNPIDLDAHAAVARLVATLEGRPAALSFLHQAGDLNPSLIPIHALHLEWLRTETPEGALAVVDKLLSLDSSNAWALREKAIILGRVQRHDEALILTETACRIEPQSPASHGVHGHTLAALGRAAAAQNAFRSSLRLLLEPGYMTDLVNGCSDYAARRNAVEFLQEECIRQPVRDDGAFLRFQSIARNVLTPEETRTALEAILASHPHHWAAWSALGTHLVEQGQVELGLSRVREAAERFPLSPRIWCDLANAYSHARQPAAEIESLRRALELSPAWGLASRALALAHERALQLDEAEHVHRRAIAASPLDGVSHAHLADLLWRRGRKPEALSVMERAIALEPSFDWSWEQLNEWTKNTEEKDRAINLAATITRARPGDAHAWLRLARFEKPTEALITLDRALSLNPRNVDIHDLRAQLLSSLDRHAEALAACRPVVFGESPPRELLGRAAWVAYAHGQADDAIAKMRQTVDGHPDYTWGWSCLTQWLWEKEELQATLQTATKWAWLAPTVSTPHAYIANAKYRMAHRREAKDAFWQALHRDPGYSYAAQTLLKWLAEDQELDEATRLLRHIETHSSVHEVRRSTVLFHIMRRDKSAAAAAFASIAAAPVEQHHLIAESAHALTEAGWRGTVEQVLDSLLIEPNSNPQIARLWVDSWAPDRRWKNLDRLEDRNPPEPILREAWAAALEHLGRSQKIWRLRWIHWRRAAWLRADSSTWGSMGYALVSSGCFKSAIKWMGTWQTMHDIKPWMLFNLTSAYYRVKKRKHALAVVQSALKLPPDNTFPDILVWRGIEHALAGEIEEAASILSRTAAMKLDVQTKLLREFTELLLEFESQNDANRPETLSAMKRSLKSLWNNNPWANANDSIVDFRARVLRRLAVRSGSWITNFQSRLPPAGRQFTSSTTMRSFGQSGWMIWIAMMFLLTAFRNCSGY